jgi:hypothetical protein
VQSLCEKRLTLVSCGEQSDLGQADAGGVFGYLELSRDQTDDGSGMWSARADGAEEFVLFLVCFGVQI